MVPKKDGSLWLIPHLSYPHGAGVNDFIDRKKKLRGISWEFIYNKAKMLLRFEDPPRFLVYIVRVITSQ